MMASLKKLSTAELKKIIDQSTLELTRRKNIDAASVEIRSILKKYKVDFQDIDLSIITTAGDRRSTKKRVKVTKSGDRRNVV